MPGEWYGGQLHIAPLIGGANDAAKSYTITVQVGTDRMS